MAEHDENDVKRWRDRVEGSVRSREKREQQWRRNIRFYDDEDNHWADVADSEPTDKAVPFDRIANNLVRSNTKRIVPAVYFRNPKILATPKRASDVDAADLIEKVMNYEIGQIDLKAQMKRMITDALLSTFGVIKIGFDSEFRINKPKLKTAFKKDGKDGSENVNITPNHIWNLRLNPFEFYIDPRAKYIDLSDAEWVVHKIKRLLKDVKDEKFYKNTTDLKASEMLKFENQPDGTNFDEFIKNENRDMIDLWEIWDRKNNEFIIMADGHDKLLAKEEWPWKMEGFPFVTHTFDFTPGQLYPKTDVDNYISIQKAVNIMLSIVVEHSERSLPRIFAEGQVDKTEIEQMIQPLTNLVVQLKNGKFVNWNPPALNQDVYNSLNILRDIANIQSSVNEFQKGVVPRGTRTATAARIIDQSSQVVQSEQGDIVQDSFKLIVRKDIQLMQQVYDIKRVIPIVGNVPGIFTFKTYTKKDIQGEFDIEVEPYSALRKDISTEKQESLQFTQLMRTMFPNETNPIELLRNLMKSFRTPNANKIILQQAEEQAKEPPKDPNTENLALAQNQEVNISLQDPHDVHIASHQNARNELQTMNIDQFVLDLFDRHIQLHQNALQGPETIQNLRPQAPQIPQAPPGIFQAAGLQAEQQQEAPGAGEVF